MFEKQVDYMEKYPNIAVLGTNKDIMDENGNNFYLKDGDFLVFSYGNKQSSSVGEDYASFGTH